MGPNTHSTEICCPECLKPLKNGGQKCGLCGLDVCGDQCQVGHNHYVECQILCKARGQPQISEDLKRKAVMAIRILASNNVEAAIYRKSRLFEVKEENSDLARFLTGFTSADLEEATWASVKARTRMVDTTTGSGSLFFPLFSLTRHSCINNAKFMVYPNHCVAMQAQKEIKAGEEITVSYVHNLEPTWKRRAMLQR